MCTALNTRSSAVAERPRDASCHWIFCWVTQGHSRSFEMTLLSTACASSYWSFHWNYVCRLYRFWDIQRQRMAWPWNRGRGRSRSLKMAPLDRSYMTFYWSTIVSIALSCTVFELFDVEYYRNLEIWVIGHSRSFKLVPFESGFLFAFHSIYGSILHHFRYKARYWSKIVIFFIASCIRRPRLV